MPDHDSLLALLRVAAREAPDRECLRIGDRSYSLRQTVAEVEAVARGLRALGIEPGDRVGLMCDNRPEALFTWLGVNAARAIDVPFNAEARGRLLAYLVQDAAPRVLIGTDDYLQVLADTVIEAPEYVVRIGGGSAPPFGERATHLCFDELVALGTGSTQVLPEPRADEIATIMYTSGTTGPSKGVMVPQRYYPAQGDHARRLMGVRADDVILCVQPLFHIDARAFLATAWAAGGTIVVGRRFSVSAFWDQVRAEGATIFSTIGTMVWMLFKEEPRSDDRKLPARLAICSSTPGEILHDFEKRFGVDVIEAYGMTECVLITSAPAGKTVPGRVGHAIPELEVRLVGDGDEPVATGQVGELVYRPREPFMMMQGYWAKPEATVEAWSNLWFHTGDLMREHPDGLEYIGRKKDSIRRRGENISAWEVEQALSAHAQVREVAAIGVASEVGEEDVAVLVVAMPGQVIDPAELVAFAARDLPRFAVPRYVEVVDSLPKTPSERIEKGKVRERGITDAAWDGDRALGRR